jgi:hypothetical protein
MDLKPVLITLMIATLPGLAGAQTSSTTRIDTRQERQQTRIDKGVESGQLNEKEAARLQRGQDRVQKAEDRAAADGTITKGERARIEHRQNEQSRRIYRQKHDRQTAK